MDRRAQRGKAGNHENYNRRNCYMDNNQFCGDVFSGFTPKEECGKNECDDALRGLPLAMAYVPWQCYSNVFECEYESLSHGTIFKDLVLEFKGRSCR